MTTPDVQISWQDYLAVALRRRWFFITPVLVSLLVGLWIAVTSPRIYEAYALIAVQDEALINPLIKGLAMPREIPDRLKTLREEILSWSSLMKLIQTTGLDRDLPPEGEDDGGALDGLVQQLRQTIGVALRGQTLIQVSFQGRDPATVQRVAKTLTDIVVSRNAEIQLRETDQAVHLIEAELAVYQQKLEVSEQNLRKFKELYLTQMPIATALNSQLRGLQIQLSQLLIDNTAEHPRVIEVQRKIEEVRRQRDEEVKRLVARGILASEEVQGFEQTLDLAAAPEGSGATAEETLQKTEEAYTALVEAFEAPEVTSSGAGAQGPQIAITSEDGTTVQMSDASVASLTLAPRQQDELIRLRRDYGVNASIYTSLLQKLERAKITGRLGTDEEGGKFRIIEPARLPVRPVRPNVVHLFVFALFFGVGLGVGAVVLAEYLDQSLQSAEELQAALEVPVLGSISTIVTEADLKERRRRWRNGMSVKRHVAWLRQSVLQPVWRRALQLKWARMDRALLRWGL